MNKTSLLRGKLSSNRVIFFFPYLLVGCNSMLLPGTMSTLKSGSLLVRNPTSISWANLSGEPSAHCEMKFSNLLSLSVLAFPFTPLWFCSTFKADQTLVEGPSHIWQGRKVSPNCLLFFSISLLPAVAYHAIFCMSKQYFLHSMSTTQP